MLFVKIVYFQKNNVIFSKSFFLKNVLSKNTFHLLRRPRQRPLPLLLLVQEEDLLLVQEEDLLLVQEEDLLLAQEEAAAAAAAAAAATGEMYFWKEHF